MSSTETAAILMVDDREENLLALEAILEPLGHDLVRARSGEEALRAVLDREFAVILLDVQMPGMNGFETAKMIKSRERSSDIPIIFLTAISKDERFVWEGYSVGAVDYLFKPFDPDVLRSKVGVFVDLHLKNARITRQERMLRESERRELELRHRNRLLESEARMTQIVGSAMDAIVSFDRRRRVTLFNAAAETMFGLPAREVEGSAVRDLFSEPEDDGFDAACDEAERHATRPGGGGGGSRRRLELPAVRAGGGQFPAEVSLSCIELPSGPVFTAIVRDVSERVHAEEELRAHAESLTRSSEQLKQLNDELSARQEDLERAMEERGRFFASISHELRTPINAILGYSSLLLDEIYGPLNEEQANGIQRAHRAGKHLLELVNDILDLSKIEAGKLELELQPAAFPGMIQELFVTVRPLADQYGSALELNAGGDERTVTTDPRRVRQILLNLISNAIKFGEGKPIEVRCLACDDGGVEVEVIDRGVGIAPEDQDKIFDEFVQLSQAEEHEGTGLGLPISRRLAVLLGGALEVASEPGEGSTFRLRLPAHLAPELPAEVAAGGEAG